MNDMENAMHAALTAVYASLDGGDSLNAQVRLVTWADSQENPTLAITYVAAVLQGMFEDVLVDHFGRDEAERIVRGQLDILNSGGTLADIARWSSEINDGDEARK